MMTATHGIVGVPRIPPLPLGPLTFQSNLSSSLQGNLSALRFEGNQGDRINVDWGDGVEQAYTYNTLGAFYDISSTIKGSGSVVVKSDGTITNFRVMTNDYTSLDLIQIDDVNSFKLSFSGLSALTSFTTANTVNITTLDNAWNGCGALASFPLIDSSNVTNFIFAWANCDSLLTFPLLDTSAGTNFNSAWANCALLTSFPLVNTSSATTLSGAWFGCSSLTTIPALDFSLSTNLSSLFNRCSSLASLPNFTINPFPAFGILFDNMYTDCTSLVCLSGIDTTDQSSTTDMFLNTPLLTNPTPAEQTAILAGSNYVNANACG